jgi:hypothetical protein
MSIFTIDKFCSKDIPSRADYNEIGLELTYSRSGSEDYYFNSNSDTLLAALVGSGSHKLNLGSMPKPGDYQALMSGINPRTDEVFCSKTRQTQLQTDNHALAGFSTSFNVEKSLSLLYANLPRNQQIKFEQAMMEAASRTIQHLEEGGHFAYRTGAQGSETHQHPPGATDPGGRPESCPGSGQTAVVSAPDAHRGHARLCQALAATAPGRLPSQLSSLSLLPGVPAPSYFLGDRYPAF